jgi:cytoskeleton protein RodZ
VAAEATWVEILDGKGQTLLSRIVQPGETVNVDGELPMRLKIGNARSTQLVFRGQAVELDAFTRDNIARVELK